VAVRVRQLVKRHKDGTEANRGIDLDVRRGEVFVLLGANGAGKTTFLRQLTMELRPTSGQIEIFGRDATTHRARVKRMMGVVPQDAGLFESLTVLEHLQWFARLKGLAKCQARCAAVETMEELGLVAETRKQVGALSGGQRRRVLVGLALLGRPPLLLLDEPTTGLDPASRRAVWTALNRAVHEGATVVLSTHHIDEAERSSDRIGIFSHGRLITSGTATDLLGRLRKAYRLSYRDPFDPTGSARIELFETAADAFARITRRRLCEYSIDHASLEDVYFDLTGERFPAADSEEVRR